MWWYTDSSSKGRLQPLFDDVGTTRIQRKMINGKNMWTMFWLVHERVFGELGKILYSVAL
jgi:hypothetical protein